MQENKICNDIKEAMKKEAMREIKFRCWDKEAKCFIPQLQLENIFWDIINNKYKNRFILMQWTGLKDKNGKGIFEGDIVIATPLNPIENPKTVKATIYYDTPRFRLWPNDDFKNTSDDDIWWAKMDCFTDSMKNIFTGNIETIEIIGNVHEK